MSLPTSVLQHILARVDLWLARALRLAEFHPDEEKSGGLYVTHAQALSQLYQVSGEATLDDDEEAALATAISEAKARAEAVDRTLGEQGIQHTVSTLALRFGLSDFEVDALSVVLAAAIEPRYATVYSYLQDDVTAKLPRVGFILELLCGAGLERLESLAIFDERAPLRRFGLLEIQAQGADLHYGNALLYEAMRVDATVVYWLLGEARLQSSIMDYAALHAPDTSPLQEEGLRTVEVARVVALVHEYNAILSLFGADFEIQRAMTHETARANGQSVIEADLAEALRNGISGHTFVCNVLRDARLHNALPAFMGWEEESVTPVMADLIFNFDKPVVLLSLLRWHGGTGTKQRHLLSYSFNHPDYTQRRQLWATHIGDASIDTESVAGQFVLTTGQIQRAAATARDIALQRGSNLTPDDLVNAARFHSTPRLGTLAYQIQPRFEWDDIVLPAEQKRILREIISMVRGRGIVLEEWGLGAKLVSSRGVSALFAGPPGTGKTMAAEVIAGELGQDLYKIDLSSVVNKYIGETEKSLGKLFDEASASNSILFFDEADALFGKRSEVKDSHDRYANIEVSYLLQRMEQYDGVTILATNLRSSMDEAFTRRLQFAIDFPFPDEQDRLRLWQTLLPPAVPRDDSIDLGLLARRFKMAGGSIRNVIVSAAHIAAANGRVVTQRHLLHGVRRELQKMGRLIDEREMRLE